MVKSSTVHFDKSHIYMRNSDYPKMKDYISRIRVGRQKIILSIKFKGSPDTTEYFPFTRKILKTYLPSIFKNKCFNSHGLTFYKEVQNTQIAHLFEHILLEYMCLAKIKYRDTVSFAGTTFWRREKPNGLYKIYITCTLSDYPFFLRALDQGLVLMDMIYAPYKAFLSDTAFLPEAKGDSFVGFLPPPLDRSISSDYPSYH